jgi:hypothetical protein
MLCTADGAAASNIRKIGNGYYVCLQRQSSSNKTSIDPLTQDPPDGIAALSLELKAKLSSRPTVSSVAAHHVLGFHRLCAVLSLPASCNQVRCVIVCQVTFEQAVTGCRIVGLRRGCVMFRQVPQLNSDGVIAGRMVIAEIVVYTERLRHHGTFDMKRVVRVFLDVIEEEAFNAPLVQ